MGWVLSHPPASFSRAIRNGCFCYDLATKPRLKGLFMLEWPGRERKQTGSSSPFQALYFALPFPCHQGPARKPRWVGGMMQLSSCGGQVSSGEAKWTLRPLQRWNQSSPGLSAASPSPTLGSDKREWQVRTPPSHPHPRARCSTYRSASRRTGPAGSPLGGGQTGGPTSQGKAPSRLWIRPASLLAASPGCRANRFGCRAGCLATTSGVLLGRRQEAPPSR